MKNYIILFLIMHLGTSSTSVSEVFEEGPMSLRQKILGCLIIGFEGTAPDEAPVQETASLIQEGLAGILPFSYNIQNPNQFKGLMHFFAGQAPKNLPLLRTLDAEGGFIWRFDNKKGFPIIDPLGSYPDLFEAGRGWKWIHPTTNTIRYFATPPALSMTQLPEEESVNICDKMAGCLKAHGINFDFAPVVDMDPLEYLCPVMGTLGRTYGTDVNTIVSYADLMIQALRSHGLLNCLKHFPGHGSAKGDSHAGFQDVTNIWKEEELEPFFQLARKADSVMTGHLYNSTLDPQWPATLSSSTLDLFRNRAPETVIISDDLFMGALRNLPDPFSPNETLTLEQSAIMALNAGCDMLILSNNPAATGDPYFQRAPNYLENIITSITLAVEGGELPIGRLNEAFSKNQTLRKKLIS